MERRRVVLVGGDLSARARVEAAATAKGLDLQLARFGALEPALRAGGADVVVLDLDEGGEQVLAELQAARAAGLAPDRVYGYYSHVDEALGAAAREAGCEPLPRGRFWRSLPELLTA